MKNEVYERITDRITALLSAGAVPWHKPWKATTGLPRNLISHKAYRGINAFPASRHELRIASLAHLPSGHSGAVRCARARKPVPWSSGNN